MFDQDLSPAKAAGGRGASRGGSPDQDTLVLPDQDTLNRDDDENENRGNRHEVKQDHPDTGVGKQRGGGGGGTYGTATRVLFKDADEQLSPVKPRAPQEQRGLFNNTGSDELTPTKLQRPRVPRQADPWHGGLNGPSPLSSPAMLDASPAFVRGARPRDEAVDTSAAPVGGSAKGAAACGEEANELDLEFAPIRAKIETHVSLFNGAVELQNCSSSVVAGMQAEMQQVIASYHELDAVHNEMLFQSNKKQRCLAIARDAFAKIEAISAERYQPEQTTEAESPAAAHRQQAHVDQEDDEEREARLAYAPTQALM